MNIGNVFVYCLYACIQMYILMSTGYLAFKKKLFNAKTISLVSELLFVFLIPVYGLIEIARIGTMEILNIFWILVVNFVCALVLSYLLAVALHYSFNLDKRVKESFNLVLAIPAMGALPLVIGKAFCFPGGPIEGDIYCQNIIGLMMLCYLILCITVFLIGYLLIISDKKKNAVIIEKMIYLWPILVDKLFGKDNAVMYLFEKFIRGKNTKKNRWKRLFDEFDKEHHDDILALYRENEDKDKDKLEPQVEIVVDTQKQKINNKNTNDANEHITHTHKKKEVYKDTFNDSYFEYCSHDSKTIKANSPIRNTVISKHPQHRTSQICIIFSRKDSFYPGNDIRPKFNIASKTHNLNNRCSNQSNRNININSIKLDLDHQNDFAFKRAKSQLNSQFPICSKNKTVIGSHFDKTPLNNNNNSLIHSPNIIIVDDSPKTGNDNNNINTNNTNNNQLKKSNEEIIVQYYQAAFDQIDKHIDNKNEVLIKEYEEHKKEILNKICHEPPKYPIVRSVLIDQKALDVIDLEWTKFEPQLKALSTSFKGFSQVSIDMNLFMKKVFCPPTVSIMLGLILSISDIRSLIFNKENFFFTNIVDGLDTLDKTMVPFLFCLIGLSAAATDGLSANTPLKKKHIILVFISRFIIIPLVGLGFIYLWKEYYGGIVKQSLAFRIIMYFPWCLPSAPNLAVVINLTQYFFEEYGYLILLQNASCVITLTILYMIYFITVGL